MIYTYVYIYIYIYCIYIYIVYIYILYIYIRIRLDETNTAACFFINSKSKKLTKEYINNSRTICLD